MTPLFLSEVSQDPLSRDAIEIQMQLLLKTFSYNGYFLGLAYFYSCFSFMFIVSKF